MILYILVYVLLLQPKRNDELKIKFEKNNRVWSRYHNLL